MPERSPGRRLVVVTLPNNADNFRDLENVVAIGRDLAEAAHPDV
jgi:hypothetical protein